MSPGVEYRWGAEAAAKLCEAKAIAIGRLLGRGREQDDVTSTIVVILNDTAKQIRLLPDKRS